ncbi:MAG: hypothetical protein R2851_15525 [Caldilineaceae bacterium]
MPTVSSAVLYDEGYLGNPLVFCGCAGLLPRGAHPTAAQVGDLVVRWAGAPAATASTAPRFPRPS